MQSDKNEKRLKRHLEQVNARLQILDMIESKLQQMKSLAEQVASEDLTEKEIQMINQQVQTLAKEVELFDTAPITYTYKP